MSAKPILCPRCQSPDITLTEYATTYLTRSPRDLEGTQRSGDIEKCVLVCQRCDHSHTMRGSRCLPADWEERLTANAALI